jgi:hypothetical protein
LEAHLKPSYDRWRRRLAGEKVTAYTQPDFGDSGFYRLPIRERAQNAQGNNNGRWKTIDWKPVALFVASNDDLVCQVGGVFLTNDGMNEQWQWFVSHPISEETWRTVAERGEPWPDLSPEPIEFHGAVTVKYDETGKTHHRDLVKNPIQIGKETIPAAGREVTAADNAAPEHPLDVQHATAIDNAIAAAIKTVKNEAEAAQALGSKNRIAELRLAADKVGKSLYEPIYRTYTAEQKKWSPIVARATAAEKSLNTAILTFREKERQRIYAEQEAAATKQREIDEANQRAADRAIAAGQPEPEPIVETVDAPVFEPAPITPTYGTRKLKEEVKTFLDTVSDFDAVYTYFKGTDEVNAFLTTLATNAIKAGKTVPGTTTRQGLI